MLNLFAYLIIPLYTVSFAWNTNWFTTNFSVISGWTDKGHGFLIWSLMVGIYFYLIIRQLLHFLPSHRRGHRKEAYLLTAACILLTLAVLTPYLPSQLPFQSMLHVIFAFTASIALLSCLTMIIWKLYTRNPERYRSNLIAHCCILGICVLLLFLAGIVSSALEIFFTISSVLLVHRLRIKVIRYN